MQEDLTTVFRSLLTGKIALTRRIDELQATYRTAKPFPHVVIDDMFAPEVLDALLVEMADMGRDKWMQVANDSRERTLRMKSAAEMGPAGERLLSIVHAAGFLHFLSEITGIPQLLPDPYLLGSGYAQMRRGDYFNVHSDRNVAYDTGLLRRLAMIVFLNKSWPPEYHGVPVPLACPSERSRQSFILYYHTVGMPGQLYVKPHTSLFAPRTHG